MPAVSFYAVLKQMRKEFGREGVRAADLAFVAAARYEYYKDIRGHYASMMGGSDPITEAKRPAGPAYSWTDPKAQAAFQKIFRNVRRSRYGH